MALYRCGSSGGTSDVEYVTNVVLTKSKSQVISFTKNYKEVLIVWSTSTTNISYVFGLAIGHVDTQLNDGYYMASNQTPNFNYYTDRPIGDDTILALSSSSVTIKNTSTSASRAFIVFGIQ